MIQSFYSRANQVEVIPIECVILRQAITLLFRLKYLRDVMLRPTIEDTGVSALNSMISFATADICSKVRYVMLHYDLSLIIL
jgi:Component of IIS longevity pathway SMK-1